MTQDCLNSLSTADVSKHLPKGIHVTGADDKSDPAIEEMSWSHLLISFDDIDCFYNKVKCRKIEKLMPTLSKLEVAEQKFL